MRKKRFTEQQIIKVLKLVENGQSIQAVCRDSGFSQATYYNWRSKYGGMGATEIKKLKVLETENRRLKQMFTNCSLENEALKGILEKSFQTEVTESRC